MKALDRSALTDIVASGGNYLPAALCRLRQCGLMRSEILTRPKALTRSLVQIAEIDLSLARLYEGHVNGLALVSVHGDASPFQDSKSILGVWGADHLTDAVALNADNNLTGTKRFCSGLGVIDTAVVTAEASVGQRMLLVDVTDPDRQDLTTWNMAGMQASRSGDFTFDGLIVDDDARLGPPGAFGIEPHLVGGVWRIAAVQAGGTLGLLNAAIAALHARGHLGAEHQIARLAPLAARTLASLPYITRAARIVSCTPKDTEAAVAQSIAARLLTEEIAQDAIAAVEQSVGLAMFDADHPVGHRARDLAAYLRQVARDALLQRMGRKLLTPDRPLSDLIYG
ncbi:acyl-CoA dehydrogenase family protein [Roseobacter litoralis]|uniref:acyl-CoA dehydrogenase family protein n=1 Tax=Roseobacter litoralis TaxID=42443 RepID=UPI002491707C|nr:acyl-CoA dehydrogenase family protein [Roseobacter litoralis]